jgi:hypothetical protein
MPDLRHNERVKLIATAINNIALAFAVAGFVAPGVGGQLVSAGRLLVGIVWCGIAAGLHLLALAILGGLKE